MFNNWSAIFILIVLFIIFFIDALSANKHLRDAVSEEIQNMIEEP